MSPSPSAPRTVGEWLAQVEPAPPSALHGRLREMLSEAMDRPVSEVPERCLDAGERALDRMLRSGSTSRDTALDLLAVDSLITYAFQAAADAPDRIEARAMQAMQRISALPERITSSLES